MKISTSLVAIALIPLCAVAQEPTLNGKKCIMDTTFIYIPKDASLKRLGVTRNEFIAQLFQDTSGPTDDELKACSLTRADWRQAVIDKLRKSS